MEMGIPEATKLRQLDEQERLAWANYVETKSPAALDVISECTKEKAKLYGATWPDKQTVKVVKKGKAE